MYYVFDLFIVLIGKIMERAKSNLKDLQKYIFNSWYCSEVLPPFKLKTHSQQNINQINK